MDFKGFAVRKKQAKDLTTAQILYGQNKAQKNRSENLYEIIDPKKGIVLTKPTLDLSEFSKAEIMYPDMMSKEGRTTYERKKTEYEKKLKAYELLKLAFHEQFVQGNQNGKQTKNSVESNRGKKISKYSDMCTMHQKPKSCDKPQEMAGLYLLKKTNPVLSNCKCEIRKPERYSPKDYKYKGRAKKLQEALKSKLESMENMAGTPLEWTYIFNSIDNIKKQGKEPSVENVIKDWGENIYEFGSRVFKP